MALPAADRYAGLLCPAGSNLLSYRGERLLLLSEGVNLKESLNHTCWQQKQDVTALLEEGTLAPGCAFLFPEAGVLAEELPSSPPSFWIAFPAATPACRWRGCTMLRPMRFRFGAGRWTPCVRTWKATGSGTGPYGCWPGRNAVPWR